MKLRKIFIISVFLILILSLGAVNASDNSTDMTVGLTNEYDDNILDSTNNDVNFENDLNQETPKLKSSSSDDDGLKKLDSDEYDVKSISPDSMEIEVPSKVEFYGQAYNENINMKISLPKNSKGNLSIYKDNIHIKTFDLSDKEFRSMFFDTCRIYSEDNNKNDIYHISYRLTNNEIGIRNFTFKYAEGTDFIEKSSLTNITYILKPSTTKISYSDKSLLITTPPDLKGKIIVEIDGRKYKTYTKIYTPRWDISYKTNYITNSLLIYSGKNQYVKISPKLKPGKHKIRITYPGDEIYPSRTVEYTITVNAKINYESFYNGDNRKVSLELPKNAKGKLVLKFYDSKKKLVKTFTRKLKKGKATITIPKRFYGKFSKVIAKYTGHDYKVKSKVMKSLVINPAIKIPERMLEGEKKFISINLPGKKGVLKLYIYKYKKNGDFTLKAYTSKLVKGKAKISLSRFNDETEMSHIQFIEILKNGKKEVYTEYKMFIILKPLDILSTNHHYGKAQVTIQAYGKNGKTLKNKYLTIKINDKVVKKVKTNKNGVVNFKIPKKYKPKTYKFTVEYKKYSLNKRIKIVKT